MLPKYSKLYWFNAFTEEELVKRERKEAMKYVKKHYEKLLVTFLRENINLKKGIEETNKKFSVKHQDSTDFTIGCESVGGFRERLEVR